MPPAQIRCSVRILTGRVVYKYRSKPKKSSLQRLMSTASLIAAGAAAIALVTILPSVPSRQSNARIITQGLSITLDRSSPAFAAMEDALMVPEMTAPEIEDQEPNVVHFLTAGYGSAELMAVRILRDNRREEALLAQARMAREFAARALAQAATQALQKVAAQVAASNTELSKKQFRADASPGAKLVAKAEKPAIQHPTRTISLKELKMSREELLSSLLAPLATAAADQLNDRVMVAGSGGLPRAVSPRSFSERNGLAGLAQKASWPAVRSPGPGRLVAPPRAQQAPSDAQVQTRSTRTPGQMVIAGPLEFNNGLALSNSSDRVVVYRERDGEVFESGAVWLREGRYEIFVDETSGTLIGELRTPHGDVLGRGLLELSELPAAQAAQYRVDKVALKISPVSHGIYGRVVTLTHTKDSRNVIAPVGGTNIDFKDLPIGAVSFKDGRFEEQTLVEGSTAILKAERAGHWSTSLLASTAKEVELRLFSDKAIAAITRASGAFSNEKAGVVWGRVLHGGKPLAGARVNIMTTDNERQAIYFNEDLQPDSSLKETSANGLYAFASVPVGTHAVQAYLDQTATVPTLLAVEEKNVSQTDIETSLDQKARVKVFDAFRTDWPLAAELTPLGLETGWMVDRSGETTLKIAKDNGALFVDAEAGSSYERVRLSIPKDRRSIFVPMIQTSWLNKVRGSMRVNKDAETGVVVGFVQGQSRFRVALEEKSLIPTSRIIYFNAKGEINQQDFGTPGGGFILFNVPEGFRSITIQPEGTAKMFSSAVLVESKVTNVISHWIR